MTGSPETALGEAGGQLKRSIGTFQLTLYGLGSMLGSGIYALIGQAASVAGAAVWLSFVFAAIIALLTAFSYASLASRYPRAGGASYVAHRAFGLPLLSFLVGLSVVCSGLTSIATQARVFAANLLQLFGLPFVPPWLLGAGFVLVLTAVIVRGIRESMWVNVVSTVVEAVGLLIVIAFGLRFWGSADLLETPRTAIGAQATDLLAIFQGSVLTFFAFLGFEDSVNLAEECRDPRRSIPRALIGAMLIGTTLYVAVAITSVSVVPWQRLVSSPSPLSLVIEYAAPVIPPVIFTAITLFAVGNTALVNYVTSSRMVYGMASEGLLPKALAKVDRRSQTPRVASLVLLAILLPLVALAGIGDLASATVLLLLMVFTVVNLSLFVLQRREPETAGTLEIPRWIPLLGTIACSALVVVRLTGGSWEAPAIAGALIIVILVLYAAMHSGPFGRTHSL